MKHKVNLEGQQCFGLLKNSTVSLKITTRAFWYYQRVDKVLPDFLVQTVSPAAPATRHDLQDKKENVTFVGEAKMPCRFHQVT